MKKLTALEVDDHQVTSDLSQNARLCTTSYPHLLQNIDDVLNSYDGYIGREGDALNIQSLGVDEELKTGLIKNYKSPPKELGHIAAIRKSSPNVCPMCGSLATSDVDHFLPKEQYPEFAVFSKNLVPACKCNSRRESDSADHAKGVRLLHPYFDSVMDERLVSCTFVSPLSFPVVTIEIDYPTPNHPQIDNIRFHVESVIRKTDIFEWFIGQWDSANSKPENVIATLPERPLISLDEMIQFIELALNRLDSKYGTPNNWESIFIHGLLCCDDAMNWLRVKHDQCYT